MVSPQLRREAVLVMRSEVASEPATRLRADRIRSPRRVAIVHGRVKTNRCACGLRELAAERRRFGYRRLQIC